MDDQDPPKQDQNTNTTLPAGNQNPLGPVPDAEEDEELKEIKVLENEEYSEAQSDAEVIDKTKVEAEEMEQEVKELEIKDQNKPKPQT